MKAEDISFFYKETVVPGELKRYKEILTRQGSIPVKVWDKEVNIYDPYLFLMLTTKELPVLNCETKEETMINGFHYLDSFVKGYGEGVEYFRKEFEVTPDTRYKNPQYVKDIYHNYFHSKGVEGWEAITRSHPLIFNHSSIKKMGFDSGMVSKVEEMRKKSPALFEKLEDKKKAAPEVKFLMKGINIPKLTDDLQERKFFDESYRNSVLDWFKGVPPEKPIPMNKGANAFVSLIADLIDQGYIQNTKKFCYTYIADSFLFKGERAELSYITRVMNPNSGNRVYHQSKTIPDIQGFKASI